ncbi:hypothetical protein [Bradyrhizobium prioriisuperbiae]|uniref:hypothetical protein n=1 Tax=Bradyrhizobium prioriisuperbiae TaxID=2854389 RepID=UPI0028E589CE|nr:hypothetical protein [Bradyrhizobium prioritasuperba]
MTVIGRSAERLAVFYLARGADVDSVAKFRRFRDSYRRFSAGCDHDLLIIFKGFKNVEELNEARAVFAPVDHGEIYTSDDSFDLGAYFDAASRTQHENVCFLNTSSEFNSHDWLLKLVVNHVLPGVGMVGATGSFEAPKYSAEDTFPNPHLRSNAFLLRRELFLTMHPGQRMTSKMAVWLFEHGPASLSRRIHALGLAALVVGKNGRGYRTPWWPASETFRQGTQSNLLVHDNQTRGFERAPMAEKRTLFRLAWGRGSVLYHFNKSDGPLAGA